MNIKDLKAVKATSGFRWTICALVFFATTINYMDRQLFSLLVPFFENDLKLGPTDLALINVGFVLPYGFAMIFIGRLIDQVGIKRGLGTGFLLWNIASIGHALVTSLSGFIGIRFLLGLGESGMFPAGVKTITDWFPRKERALATGFFNAGANLGAILAPVLGVAIATAYGWRACFMFTGLVGLIWIFFWLPLYKNPEVHPKVSKEELAHIRSDNEPSEKPISFSQLFALKPIYGLMIAKALSDAPWWFYLTWMPKFLSDQFHVSKQFMALAIPVVYIVADVGSVWGGWLSSNFIKRGKSVGTARKLTMLACALMVLPVMTVGLLVDQPALLGIPCVFWAVAIVAIAAGAHQGWSSNLFTMISDTVPSGSVAMAVGAINGVGMLGPTAMQFVVGRSVQLTSSYTLPFIMAGSLYLISLGVLQIFLPTVQQVTTEKRVRMPYILAGGLAVVVGLLTLQYIVNKPPYMTLTEYQSRRATELKTDTQPLTGPIAKVGWMEARWFLWQQGTDKPKLELVKLDTHGHAFIEAKGSAAAQYKGPTPAELKDQFHITQ